MLSRLGTSSDDNTIVVFSDILGRWGTSIEIPNRGFQLCIPQSEKVGGGIKLEIGSLAYLDVGGDGHILDTGLRGHCGQK